MPLASIYKRPAKEYTQSVERFGETGHSVLWVPHVRYSSMSAMTHMSVRISALDHQREFFLDQESTEIYMQGGYGQGKTHALAVKQMLLRVANCSSNGILLVPTYGDYSRIHKIEWPQVMADQFGVHLVVKHDPDRFVWPWGCVTWVISAENPDRLKGPNVGDVCVDEPGLIPFDTYLTLLGRKRCPRRVVSQAALAGTPEGIGWPNDRFVTNREPGCRFIKAEGWHAAVGAYPYDLARAYRKDAYLYKNFVEGNAAVPTGGCYKMFRRDEHVTERCEYNHNLPLVLACDFNIDYMRWLVCQFTFDEIRVFDEIAPGRNCTTEQAAKEFVSRYGAHRTEVTVTGDAAGEARKTSASQVDYQVIIEVLRSAGLIITKNVSCANPRQRERVDSVNYHLAGRGRSVFIHPRCKELILDLERNVWKEGTSEIDKSDMARTHAADAFGYAVYNLARPSVVVRQEIPKPLPVHRDAAVYGVW